MSWVSTAVLILVQLYRRSRIGNSGSRDLADRIGGSAARRYRRDFHVIGRPAPSSSDRALAASRLHDGIRRHGTASATPFAKGHGSGV
jgi:hypothetical protein